jgi:hypothetical protein
MENQQITKTFILKCHFCGIDNEYMKEDIYDSSEDTEVFKQKYCLSCGEPLIFQCPNCKTTFRLDLVFEKDSSPKELDSFWEPTFTKVDELIPFLEEQLKKFESLMKECTPQKFRANQKLFLEKISDLKIEILDINNIIANLQNTVRESNLNKLEKQVNESIQENLDEIKDIFENIEPEFNLVNLKKEKRIKKKGLPFPNMIDPIHDYIQKIKMIRHKQIQTEKQELKPGYKKFKKHFKIDPGFYRIKCPKCNLKIYNIDHQIYSMENKEDQLKFIRKTKSYYDIHEKEQKINSLTKSIQFKVTIDLYKQKEFHFHGKLGLVLHKNEPYIIGRDIIRDVEYREPTSMKELYNEDDPLGRVSNSQITLELRNKGLHLQAKTYDERRVGTYLNSKDHDIRSKNPEGLYLSKGDCIIIPLIKEDSLKNKIILEYLK